MLFHEGSTLLGVVNALLAEVDPGLIRRLAQPIIGDMNRDHGAAPKISQQPASPVGQAA